MDDKKIEAASVANTYEPPPIAGERPVYPIVQKLINDRVKFGFEKYGTYLMTHNGRKATKDAIQEVLDLLFYLVQKDMEENPQDYLE